jgi:hypothetical protein
MNLSPLAGAKSRGISLLATAENIRRLYLNFSLQKKYQVAFFESDALAS